MNDICQYQSWPWMQKSELETLAGRNQCGNGNRTHPCMKLSFQLKERYIMTKHVWWVPQDIYLSNWLKNKNKHYLISTIQSIQKKNYKINTHVLKKKKLIVSQE